jgi:hypothetical protein
MKGSSPFAGFDEIQEFDHGTFDAVCGNLTAPSGRGSRYYSLDIYLYTHIIKEVALL